MKSNETIELNELSEVAAWVMNLLISGDINKAHIFSSCKNWKEVRQKKTELKFLLDEK